jgi:hypothetical protein
MIRAEERMKAQFSMMKFLKIHDFCNNLWIFPLFIAGVSLADRYVLPVSLSYL